MSNYDLNFWKNTIITHILKLPEKIHTVLLWHISAHYVDLSDIYVDQSVIYVDLSEHYVTFLNLFSRYVTNVINITVYPEKMLNHAGNSYITHRKQLCQTGYSYVSQDTAISPSRVYVLHGN